MKKTNIVDAFFHWAGLFSIIAGLFLILYFWYLLCYPVKVLDIKVPYKVLNKRVEIGDYLKYEVEYCKNLPLRCDITVQLHNEVIVELPTAQGNIETGCHKVVAFTKIPETPLIIGKAKLSLTYTYHVNAFRDVSVRGETEEFEIVGKK